MAVSNLHTANNAHYGIVTSIIGKSVMSVAGVITDYQINLAVQTQNELNEVGSTISRVQYDERYEGTVTMQVKTNDADAFIAKTFSKSDVKTKITLDRDYYVSGIDVIESNKNFTRIQFKVFASRYVGNGGSGVQVQNEDQSK